MKIKKEKSGLHSKNIMLHKFFVSAKDTAGAIHPMSITSQTMVRIPLITEMEKIWDWGMGWCIDED